MYVYTYIYIYIYTHHVMDASSRRSRTSGRPGSSCLRSSSFLSRPCKPMKTTVVPHRPHYPQTTTTTHAVLSNPLRSPHTS